MKAQNRHDTLKWKQRRKHKLADLCKNPKCFICHGEKVLKIPDRRTLKHNIKIKKDEF